MPETDVRIAAFLWLREKEAFNGGVFEGTELNEGFVFEGRRITLKGASGIWFPAGFNIPISITSASHGQYEIDEIDSDGIISYAYRGSDRMHRDNVGLREALRTRTPLVYFKEIRAHRFQAIWPVMILEDHSASLFIRAAIDPAYAGLRPGIDFAGIDASPLDVRRYAWGQTRVRLHQEAFREVVVAAYDRRCAVCRLNHPELLDAAHIIPDSDDRGTPIVQNGLSLCKIHHAAYDQNILGVSPDCIVHIRRDILDEHDGPMLKHGLQELDGSGLTLPRHAIDRPDPERLAERFQRFRSA